MEVQEGGCGRVERLNRRADIYKEIKSTQRKCRLEFQISQWFVL